MLHVYVWMGFCFGRYRSSGRKIREIPWCAPTLPPGWWCWCAMAAVVAAAAMKPLHNRVQCAGVAHWISHVPIMNRLNNFACTCACACAAYMLPCVCACVYPLIFARSRVHTCEMFVARALARPMCVSVHARHGTHRVPTVRAHVAEMVCAACACVCACVTRGELRTTITPQGLLDVRSVYAYTCACARMCVGNIRSRFNVDLIEVI